MQVYWLRASKIWWVAGLIFMLAILAIAGYRYYLAEFRVEPASLITEAIAKARQAGSYRYQIQSYWSNGQDNRPWTQIEGEKAGDSYHFKGTILGTPVEIYQIGSRSFTLDPINNQWYILDGVDMTRQQISLRGDRPAEQLHVQGGLKSKGDRNGTDQWPQLLGGGVSAGD